MYDPKGMRAFPFPLEPLQQDISGIPKASKKRRIVGRTKKMELNPHLNLIVLGKKRAGKSLTANTILGRKAFPKKIDKQDVAVESATLYGFSVTVYDTPGFCDPQLSEEEIQQKLEEVLQKCESERCVFLLVIKADTYTEEERKTVEKFEELLGEKHLKNTWILFTRGDELEEDNMTIQEFLDRNAGLKALLKKYDHRYHVFKNKKIGASDQARLLLVKIIQQYFGVNDGGMLTRCITVQSNTCDESQTAANRMIVLLGKTGVGKSAAGNIILGQKLLQCKQSTCSVTSNCSKKDSTVSGRSVSVVDTPGFFDTHLEHEDLVKEIGRSVYKSSPGPHAFLIVFPVSMRFTEQEQQIPQMIEMMFGKEVLKYSIILFTHGDQLEESLDELIEENCKLRALVQQCGGRYQLFNNKDLNNREQVNDLLQKIDSMIQQNGGGHYSNQMYEDAHRLRQEEEEERRREEEERKQQEEKQKQDLTDKEREMEAKKEKQRQENLKKSKTEKRGFDNFFNSHKSTFELSAPVVSSTSTAKYIGGTVGGVVGGLWGFRSGLSGMAAGVVTGATAGAALSDQLFTFCKK